MAKTITYITSEELNKHNKSGDLWISIQGKVYDVSEWANHHPGGELPLLNFGGQDATDVFVAYHPGSAWQYLNKYFNGMYLEDYVVSEASKDYRKLVYEFSKMGLFEQKGHLAFYTILAMAMLLALSVYGVLLCEGFYLHSLCGVMIGLVWVQSGWVGHDSGHYQIMPNRKLNRCVQILTGNCITGVSMVWWKRNHNAHHIACNNLEYDPDLQLMPVFAVSSKFFQSLNSYFYQQKMDFSSVCRLLVCIQHWTFYPVMGISRVVLFAQSSTLLMSNRKVPNRSIELAGVLVFWIWYPLLVSMLPNWRERLMFVVASFMMVGLQHVQFFVNHCSSSVYIGEPKGNDWFEKQTSGTLNITCSPWMDWFHGGLQFQIEHHLFPRLPRCNHRKISPFVRELCKKHGLMYNSATFFEANVRTFRTLRDAALQARDLTKPLPSNLVWEAINTPG